MPAPIRLWIAADHHAAFRCGGWARLRQAGGDLAGQAGGARNTTAGANALCGLAAALKALPPGEIELHLSDPAFARAVAALPQLAAAGWRDAKGGPLADQSLWLEVAAGLSPRTWRAAPASPEPRTPMAFAAAWADLARDRAKAQGPFAAPIPKPNLAKAQGL
jgi:hypothetical protein